MSSMPRLSRPWLSLAALVAGAGYAIGRRRRSATAPGPPALGPGGSLFPEPDVSPATAEENRIEALTKLKALRDEGVLTQLQYESERERLTEGIR
jgi:uncharacterized protein YbjT (DUF2867 family)